MRDALDSRQLNYVEAIREALDQALLADPRVLIIGEGVPDPKSIFTSTAGLQERHGKHRVFDMPLSENGLTGVCIGAALSGMRPVMIHQRVDFALLAMDQIVNNAAKWHYMFDGRARVPMVIRMIVGRGWGQGPQHSQSLQAMFAQVPGLKVVMPTTAHDAKGMMIAAIEDDNPVVFIEHRWLHHVRDYVPAEMYRTPIGAARVLHEGNELTVAAFSYMAFDALIAARSLFECMGVSVNVLDMRTARPLDVESVRDSVRKTGRLIVADTAHKTGGLAGELVAQIAEKEFAALCAAPERVACPDHPVPTSPFMARDYYPGPQAIADAVLRQLGRDLSGSAYEGLRAALERPSRHDAPNREFSGPF